MTRCICLPQSHLGLPHEPELKDVDVSATLDCFVPCVIGDIVLFVWLEQVAGTHGVTACHDSLQTHIKNTLLTYLLLKAYQHDGTQSQTSYER